MLKYYVYVSDAKVNMLYDQMSTVVSTEQEKKLSAKFGLWATNEVSGEMCSKSINAMNRYKKLKGVIDSLKANKEIGSLTSGKEYISGTAVMGWETTDHITMWGNHFYSTNRDEQIVVILFGSSQNIIGNHTNGEFRTHSIYPCFLKAAKDMLINANAECSQYFDNWGQAGVISRDTVEYSPETWQLMEGMTYKYRGPSNRFEFLAKVLYRESFSLDYRVSNKGFLPAIFPAAKTTYVLATPLYVAISSKKRYERILRIDNMNYLKVNLAELKSEYTAPFEYTELENEIVNRLQEAGLFKEAQELIERLNAFIPRAPTDEAAMDYVWKVIANYIVDCSK